MHESNKQPLIVVSKTVQPLSVIAEHYDVTEYPCMKELQRHAFCHVPQIVLVFTSGECPPRLPGFTVIIVTDDEELLAQRWSDGIGVFDIIDNNAMFADPLRRLYVYQSLQTIIGKYKGRSDASAYSVLKELYRLTRKADEVTGNHHINSVRFLHTMYKTLKNNDGWACEDIAAAILHDVGKLFVPEKILMKPGSLTIPEFTVIQNHPTDGRFILHRLIQELPQISGLHKHIPCIELHHEKWDGSGYPHGLKQNQIPLPVRMMTITDVYDALIAKRPYKDPLPHDRAVSIIIEGAGTHFDPDLIKVFREASAELEVIKKLSWKGGAKI